MLHLAPVACALLLSPQSAPAAPAEAHAAGTIPLEITLEQIMADPEWIGRSPRRPFWSPDSSEVFYWREREGMDVEDLWRIPLASGTSELVEPAQRAEVAMPRGDWSADRRLYAFERSGDLFVLDVESGSTRQLTRTSERESGPRFALGDGALIFRRSGSFYRFEFSSGLVSQLADLRAADDPDEEEDDFDYLEAKQERLFGELALREALEKEQREHARALETADPTRAPRPWYLGDDVEVAFDVPSPDGRWLLVVTRSDSGAGGDRGTMPSYVTDSGYVETREVRRRVGRNAPDGHALLLLDLERREKHELDFEGLPGIAEDPFAALRPEAIEWHVAHGADRAEVEAALAAPDQRDVRVEDVEWSADARQVVVRIDSVDNKDRWLASVDLAEPRLVARDRLHDPAWINWRSSSLGWLPDDRSLWFLSERSGYAQVWLLEQAANQEGEPIEESDGADAGAGSARRITSGDFVVSNVEESPDGRYLYFRGNASDPAVWEIYRVEFATGTTEQLTRMGGDNDYGLSPDGAHLWVLHSEVDRPAELFLQEAVPGAPARQVTRTISPEFAALPWQKPRIVDVPSSHGERPVRARLYLPSASGTPTGEDAQARPAVVFVHGAGYLQNVHAGWSSYFREYLFHTLLARNGYVVLDLDYRGSAGYGRDWRTAVYRRMGHPEVEDLKDAAQWLQREHNVDPARIGLYGGSYGGFLTFMALFREPGLFAAGAALRPVTDWSHYNHGYTSNILNTPLVDPMAYERSSPLEYAEGLDDALLICGGMEDDNVFFQDTVLLVQRLLELKKSDFETAFYPLEPHSFRRPESWLDEYRRIFELFEETLKPASGR